jgi:hypothetical protein
MEIESDNTKRKGHGGHAKRRCRLKEKKTLKLA